MDLGSVFKLSLYGLTALVGAILGAAEGEGAGSGNGRHGLVLPFLSLPIVVCGYLVTERRRRKEGTNGTGLSSTWANVLGLVALVATGYEFSSENREGKLLAGTHLLLYATWIVLFQQKTVRLYWFLMALGILQLAVASVLTTKGWFGFCSLGYTFGAVWTLSIFSLWRAEQHFEEEERRRLVELPARRNGGLAPLFGGRLNSEVRSSVQHEGGTRWLSARFVSGVLMTTCSALLVSAAFFAFIPRVWVGASVSFSDDHDILSGLGKKTGLATTVRLGDLGSILESTERVFEIQIVELKTGRTISAQAYAERLGLAEPLFRAAVLTGYEKGVWKVEPATSLLSKPFERTNRIPEIQQEIRLEPNGSNVLYCMNRPLTMVNSKREHFGEYNQMSCVSSQGDRRLESSVLVYDVFTSLPTRQPLNYKEVVSPAVRESYRRSQYFDRTKKLPPGLDRLQALTREIVERETTRRQAADGGLTPRNLTPLEVATAIEAHLRDSGQYGYTLDQSIQNPNIDPVEDFLFNRTVGHCEYFATALTLMLRAADIPARMVSGYKGGIPHLQKKNVLEVQQRFAHVWVEAWVDKEGWTTFDATPVDARSLSVAGVSAKKTSLWGDVRTTLSGIWSDNVLNMSLDLQEESIYRPMRELAYALLTFFRQLLTSPESALRTFGELLTNRDRWFSLGGGLFTFAFMACSAAIVWSVRWVILRTRQWMIIRAGRRNRQSQRIVEFYERFVRLLLARGLSRATTQTQREFAALVASAYSPELNASGLKETPERISQLFYRVRFGEENLCDADVRQLEDLLTNLERALSNGSNHDLKRGFVRPA